MRLPALLTFAKYGDWHHCPRGPKTGPWDSRASHRILLTSVATLFCGALAAQPASFEGTAINTAGGRPMSGVHVSLIGISLTGGARDAYGSMSDTTGRFSISGIPAGTYVIFTERRGFVHLEKKKGGIPIPSVTLKAGEHIADFKLEMTPVAVISGRVVDEVGDPVEHAQVHAEETGESGLTSLNIGLGEVYTDDRGSFRLTSAPGRYRVLATPRNQGRNGPPEIWADGSSPMAYGRTYFSSTSDEKQATPVDAAAGAEISGIEIRLVKRTVHPERKGSNISGTVHGFPPGGIPQEHTTVWLLHGQKPDEMDNSSRHSVAPGGNFEFENFAPGFYRIWATYSAGKTYLQSQPVEFQLSAAGVGNLQLSLGPGGDLAGTVEVPTDRPGAPKEKRTVHVGESWGDTGRDGAFHLTAVQPGKYGVEIEPLPENGYIQSMVLDGAKIDGAMLDVPNGVHAAKLKITVGIGAQITGTVLDKDGVRLSNSLTMVLLTQDGKPTSDTAARVDDSGTYSLHGIRPGRYRLVAVDIFQSGAFRGRDEAMKRLAEKGEEIELRAGDHVAKDVKIVEGAGDDKE